ncbi:MAG: hypothetical protein V4617_08115 [Gemmatimonadota bacterium]
MRTLLAPLEKSQVRRPAQPVSTATAVGLAHDIVVAAAARVCRHSLCTGLLLSGVVVATSSVSAQIPAAQFDRRTTIIDDPAKEEGWGAIGSILESADGTLYVTFPSESVIRVFARNGSMLRKFGRVGAGPGEFSGMGAAGWRGDTLWVHDDNGRRFNLFLRSGTPARTVGAPGVMLDGFGMEPSTLLAGDRFLYRGQLSAARMASKEPRVVPVAVGLLGSPPIVIVRTPTAGLTLVTPHRGQPGGTLSGGTLAQRLSADGIVRTAPDGRSIISVERPIPRSANSAVLTITRFAADGTPSKRVVLTSAAMPVSQRDQDAFVAMLANAARKMGEGPKNFPSTASAIDYVRSQLTVPAFYPAASAMLPGADGTVWLRGLDDGRPMVEWTVLNSELTRLFRVPLPREYTPRYATGDRVWGTMKDENDIPTIVEYSRRPPRR